MDNNMTYPIEIEHIKSFVKKHLPYMITLVVPVIYFVIMLPHYVMDYYVPDFTAYCSAAINGNPTYDGFSSMFMLLSGIATISPRFITVLCLILMTLALFHLLNFFRQVLCKNMIQFIMALVMVISCGLWYYFYGKVFYDWPFTIYTYSVCLFSLQKMIMHCRKDGFRFKDWYIFCILMGFMLSWKPYNIFLAAGLVFCMICHDEIRNNIITNVLKRGVFIVIGSLVLAILGYMIGNFNFILDPIGTWEGIKAYPASSDFWGFMLTKERIIWDQICDLPFNISVMNLVSMGLLIFALPLFIRKVRYLAISLFMTLCFYLYITYFSPGLVWHGFSFGGFVLTMCMFMISEVESRHCIAGKIIIVALFLQCIVNFAFYIPIQNNWSIETEAAIMEIKNNEEQIAEDVSALLQQVPKEATAIDCAVKRFKPVNLNAQVWNIPAIDNPYISIKNKTFVDPLWSANYAFWSQYAEQYVHMAMDCQYYIYIIPNAYYRIGDVVDLNKYSANNILQVINHEDYTIILYEKPV